MPLPALLCGAAGASSAWLALKFGALARGGTDAAAAHAVALGGGGAAAAEAEGAAALVGGGAALAVAADSFSSSRQPSVRNEAAD
jgi:hypothetical protein